MSELHVGESVRVIVGGPHENFLRRATVSRFQSADEVVIYFGDEDEDEWLYAPSELEPWR